MITYEEACEIVFSASPFGICLGLDRMKLVLEQLGHPEKKIPAIHLAGTNGKGSTLTYLKSVYEEAGLKVGTYTSPAIQKINDKIQLNGAEIPDFDFAKLIEKMKPAFDEVAKSRYGPVTEFEMLTALAFEYFATVAKPDIVLIETGLGGRLDSTNVITPLVSIITNIGHDHMDLLGNTIEAVAKEKAGIIKQGVPVISGCKQKEAIKVMSEQAASLHAPLYQASSHFQIKRNNEYFDFHTDGLVMKNVQAGMLGIHQQENAALALMAIHLLQDRFPVTETTIRTGIRNAKIANRIEVVKENPTIIFDGGHNPEGIEALCETLKTTYINQPIRVLFCAMKDKNIEKMLKPLEAIAKEIVLTSFQYERAMDPFKTKEIYGGKKIIAIENAKKAYDYLIEKTAANDVLVVTGSLYFLAHIKKIVNIP